MTHRPVNAANPTTTRVTCAQCSSEAVTYLSMTLTDGTPVDFTSCHACEHKTWTHDGRELDRSEVLARTRKLSG